MLAPGAGDGIGNRGSAWIVSRPRAPEGVGEHGERKSAGQRVAGAHHRSPARAIQGGLEQAGLADPRLALDEHYGCAAISQRSEARRDPRQLELPAEEGTPLLGHLVSIAWTWW